MSIRPVQLTLPTPPTAGPARQTAETPGAPAAAVQNGASVVSGTVQPEHAKLSGMEGANEAATNGNDGRTRPTPEGLTAAIARAQKVADAQAQELSFSVHEETGEVVVKIIDRESKEVIRQIPAEEMLRIAERLQEVEGTNRPGLLLKQEA